MKQTKVICDACGEEVNHWTGASIRITECVTSNAYDICEVCLSAIRYTLNKRLRSFRKTKEAE